MRGTRQRGILWLMPRITCPGILFLGTLLTMGASILRRHRVLVATEASFSLPVWGQSEESQIIRWFLQAGFSSIYSLIKSTRV